LWGLREKEAGENTTMWYLGRAALKGRMSCHYLDLLKLGPLSMCVMVSVNSNINNLTLILLEKIILRSGNQH
jgi:hypothetical protein